MNPFDSLTQPWNDYVVLPLVTGLTFLGELLGSGGLAIILFTIAIRLVMFPLSLFQMKSQRAMTAIQPLIRDVQKKYGNDRERVTQETMRIYKENGVNPASGCAPLFVQMPIFIGLYSALSHVSHDDPTGHFHEPFLWLAGLAVADQFFILPVLSGITQLVQQRMMTQPTNDPQQQMMNRMMIFMPLVFLGMSATFPSGLVLYWVTSNVVSIVQQYFTTGWGSLFPLIPGGLGSLKSLGLNMGSSKNELQSGTSSENDSDAPSGNRRGSTKSSGKRKRGGKR